ncbi:MAG: HDOD domain-containing protein [Gammaproteobacteria bacterium]|nr:HDOD domain-containing protein [Gammaproteobacteria bacterium]
MIKLRKSAVANDTRLPDVSTLRRIRQLADLSDAHLINLANQLQILSARDGQLLIETGSTEKKALYILDGRVSLIARDGKTRVASADPGREMKPVAQLRPCIYDVKALGPVNYVKIDGQKLADFTQLAGVAADDISVHSLFTDDADEDNSIVNHLYRNLMDNSIKLPSLPSVAERMQQIYRGESTDIDAMVRILIAYPDISRKIKNVARCPGDSDMNTAEKIRYSVEQLGMLAVYCLVMTYAVGKLVRRLPLKHMQRVRSFWDHSLNVAALGRILAKKHRSISSDLAMLAGLVHGIGVLAIDDRLLEHHHLMLDHLEVDHAIQVMRPEISSLLLRKWNFLDELIRVSEECGDWTRDIASPPDLCDLVLVANYYSMMQGDRNHTLPRVCAVPAIEHLRITPEESINALKRAPDVVRNIKKLFV